MSISWLYNNKSIEPNDIPEKAVGFIYVITDISTSQKYIGRKLLTKAAQKTVNGKKRSYRKESDWKDYWSSSPYLLEKIEKEGTGKLKREILCFAFSKGELNYLEEKLQYTLGVLESDKWINTNIRSKMFKRNVIKYPSLLSIQPIIKSLKI